MFKHSLCATAALIVTLCSQCRKDITALIVPHTGTKEPVTADDAKDVYGTN